MIMKLILSLIPSKIKLIIYKFYNKNREIINSIRLFRYDLYSFHNYSNIKRNNNNWSQITSLLITYNHSIEKGLSLKHPRKSFGMVKIEKLKELINQYIIEFDVDDIIYNALSSLKEYYIFNDNLDEFTKYIDFLSITALIDNEKIKVAGTKEVDYSEIRSQSTININDFYNSRFSIRNFSKRNVEDQIILDCISASIKTPSNCNRQPWKIKIISEEKEKEIVFSLQKGNRGFGDSSNKLLAIFSDLSSYSSLNERHQPWVDGGMFSMSIIYALHSQGIGSCCLNWAQGKTADKELKKKLKIDNSYAIIMFIAIGHIPQKLKVAHSKRKDMSKILI